MNKPRAFLFDVDDWLGSFTVEKMSGDQVKAYVYLLCRAWHETPIATLPNNPELLARIVGLSPETWAQIEGPIMARFKANGNDRIYHPKLLATYKEAKRKYENRAKAAGKRWGMSESKA